MPPRSPDILAEAERFAGRCGAERGHWEQVRRLSMQLFDALADALHLEKTDRFLLECAAILHDIGWCRGQKGHHKQSMNMILEDASLPLTPEERIRIALTARYHRKALPKPDHPVYGTLRAESRKRIEKLAGILRIADGLDCSHQSLVETLRTELRRDCLRISCRCRGEAREEFEAARKKADLLECVLGVRVEIAREVPDADLY